MFRELLNPQLQVPLHVRCGGVCLVGVCWSASVPTFVTPEIFFSKAGFDMLLLACVGHGNGKAA